MPKAIAYLEELSEREDNIEVIQARCYLSMIYEDEIYLKRNTILSNKYKKR